MEIRDTTHLLSARRDGDAKDGEKLLPIVYGELRRLAAVRMADQPGEKTLQPTALVHEAWLKLNGKPDAVWNDRRHFFRAAAEAMRQILIDRARRRQRLRHGGGAAPMEFDDVIAAPDKDEALLDLDAALDELALASPERAELVRLRYFVGLSEIEIAQVLGISERSVQRQWSYARAWLFARIEARKKN